MEQVHEGWHPKYSSSFWLLFLILKIVWVYFPAPVAIQINAGQTKQKSFPVLKRDLPALVWSIFTITAWACIQLLSITWTGLLCNCCSWLFSALRKLGFFSILSIWMLLKAALRSHSCCSDGDSEGAVCLCLGVGHGTVWWLRAALQEVAVTCSAPETLDVFARVSARATAALAAPKADLGLICAFTANPEHLQSAAWPRAAVLSSASICA